MNKAAKLLDLLLFVNTQKRFTARDIASEFNISVRTAHRYLADLEETGVPLYTEPGRNGGYRVLANRTLPPVVFNEEEVLAIFFSFQSLKYFKSLPFKVDIDSAARKLFSQLPEDAKRQIDNLRSSLLFWNHRTTIETPLLKQVVLQAVQKKTNEIHYQSRKKSSVRTILPIGVYADHGKWYLLAQDCQIRQLRTFRVDRILTIKETTAACAPLDITLEEFLRSYKVKNPIRLYVKLTQAGVRACRDNPYFETSISQNEGEKTGYIDRDIDASDFDYSSRFFMSLGLDAKVILPIRMRKNIYQQATLLQQHYKES